MCSNIQASPAYGAYILQLFRYARASSNYSDFLKHSANLELLIDTKGAESVFRRRIDNTMAKRKKYKWTKNDLILIS
jgi:hypothetical protein